MDQTVFTCQGGVLRSGMGISPLNSPGIRKVPLE